VLGIDFALPDYNQLLGSNLFRRIESGLNPMGIHRHRSVFTLVLLLLFSTNEVCIDDSTQYSPCHRNEYMNTCMHDAHALIANWFCGVSYCLVPMIRLICSSNVVDHHTVVSWFTIKLDDACLSGISSHICHCVLPSGCDLSIKPVGGKHRKTMTLKAWKIMVRSKTSDQEIPALPRLQIAPWLPLATVSSMQLHGVGIL